MDNSTYPHFTFIRGKHIPGISLMSLEPHSQDRKFTKVPDSS